MASLLDRDSLLIDEYVVICAISKETLCPAFDHIRNHDGNKLYSVPPLGLAFLFCAADESVVEGIQFKKNFSNRLDLPICLYTDWI